jgi:hypothetical protein
MKNHTYSNQTGNLAGYLSDAVSGGFVQPLALGIPWGAYKSTGYPLASFNPGGGRYNEPSQPGYSFGSGSGCCLKEVRGNVSGKVFCGVSPITINAFNIGEFAKTYRYGEQFFMSQESGGYLVPRFVLSYLQQNFGITGILYPSYALRTLGETGWCVGIFPPSGAPLPTGIYVLPSGYYATSSGISFVPDSTTQSQG